MERDEAVRQAAQLIDLEIRGKELLTPDELPLSKEVVLSRVREISSAQASPDSASPEMVAWLAGEAALRALWDSGQAAQPVAEALADVVADSAEPLSRRQAAAGILSEGRLAGKAAQVMIEALKDPDPSIVQFGIWAVMRLPSDVRVAALPVVERLRDSLDPSIAKSAKILCKQHPYLA